MFHALAGNGEGEWILSGLRKKESLALLSLEEALSRVKEMGEVTYLTNKNSELCSTPLKGSQFFGREKELFDLTEMLAEGGKYLISGMGGIGKTELMRQFLMHCEEERLADHICVIQYEKDLASSIVKAFPQVCGTNLQENFQEAMTILRSHAKERLLVVIDNMDRQENGPELEALRGLSTAVFITSRCQHLDGFETYPLHPISVEAGSLILRDNYGKPVSKPDRAFLEKIVGQELWRHTLTLRLLGRCARYNGWTLETLYQRMEIGEEPLHLGQQEEYSDIHQIYHRMYRYSDGSGKWNRLLRVLALLPYESRSQSFLQKYFADFLDTGMAMEQVLEELWVSGWLEKQEDHYSMHPFVAECMRTKPVDAREIKPFLERLIGEWETTAKGFQLEWILDILYDQRDMDSELHQATLLVGAIVDKLAEDLPERYLPLLLLSMSIESIRYGRTKIGQERLTRQLPRVEQMTDEMRMYYGMLLCIYGYGDLEQLAAMFRRGVEGGRVSERLCYAFAQQLAVEYVLAGNVVRATELTDYVWQHCNEEDIRLSVCVSRAAITMQQGDFAGYEEWLQRGLQIGRSSGRDKTHDMEQLLGDLCSLKLAFGRFEEAEALIRELEQVCKENPTYSVQYQITFYKGSMAMHRGEPGYGISFLEEADRLGAMMFYGNDEINRAVVLGELAMACNKAKQYEKAQESYQNVLAIYDAVAGHEFERHRVLNNMSVMYLDWGKPKDALPYLTEAYEMGKQMGGLAAAEPANNLSKAWRALGDRKQELAYLQEALPVLEQCYGSEHPKVIDGKKRMEE